MRGFVNEAPHLLRRTAVSRTLQLRRESVPKWRIGPLTLTRALAQGSSPSNAKAARRQVTVAGDDGRVKWGELSRGEKAARTTQQSINFTVVIFGAVGLVVVGLVLFQDVFSPHSKTSHFNSAVNQIKRDLRCTELLGPKKTLKAYGEETGNRWARNRPVASSRETDRTGTEHLRMRFYIEGSNNKGTVNLNMIKRPGESSFEYRFLALDVPGHPRIWLENADAKGETPANVRKFFGVRWN